MSVNSPPNRVPDTPLISTPDFSLNPRDLGTSVRQGNPVPKELSRSSDNVIVEYTGNLVRKLTVLKVLPERPPVPVVPKRKTVVKSTKLVTTSYPDACDVQIKKKTPQGLKKSPEKSENKIVMDSEAETHEIQETQNLMSGGSLHLDATLSPVSNSAVDSSSPAYSREQKAEFVKQQRQKRLKEQTEERLKKKAEIERKKQKLAELKNKQLKIVENNVRRAKLKRQKQKTEVPKSPEEQQQKTSEISVPKLNLLMRSDIEIPDFIGEVVSEQAMEETIQHTQETKSSFVVNLDEVLQAKPKETDEFILMKRGKRGQISLMGNKLQETSELVDMDKFEALHPNVTRRAHAQLDTSNVTIRESLPLDEDLESSKTNLVPFEFPEDPLVTKIKNTLREINLLRSGGGKRMETKLVIPQIAFNTELGNTENYASVNIAKAVNEAVEIRKKQEAAASKIQAAFRRYRTRKLDRDKDNSAKKYVFFKNPEAKLESKTPSVRRSLHVKRAADKNWKASKYPSPPKSRKESDSQSDWLKPTYVKPSGYNIMTAIENTIKSRSEIPQSYWYQANLEHMNKSTDANVEPTQTVPVIDASKNKPKKQMTVGQFLRASEMSKEVLQSYFVSDEESSRAEADVSAISTLTEGNSSSDESKVRWRKQVHLKLQEVLPDRVTPRWWSKSDTQILNKFSSLKSRKKLFVHTSKENVGTNVRPANSAEALSRMYSAVTPKKLKQKHYGLVAPNVELRRKNERARALREKDMSDTNTWNSHVTYRQSTEMDKRNETLKGIPVDLSSRVDDPATWESHTTQKQRTPEVQSDSKRTNEVSDTNRVLSPKPRKIKNDIFIEETGGMRHVGKKYKVSDERNELEKEKKLSPRLTRKGDTFHREKLKHVKDRMTEKETTIGEPTLPDDDIPPGTMLHPSALHLQFQAEMNRLESIEECRHHLTAIQTLFSENVKAKKKVTHLQRIEDKQIEAKPKTIESSAQTIDLLGAILVPPAEQAMRQSSTQTQYSGLNKHLPSSGNSPRILHSDKMENCTQTEESRDVRLGENVNLTFENKHISHDYHDNTSDQALHINIPHNIAHDSTQTEFSAPQHREITPKNSSYLQNRQNITRRPIRVAEVLQESYETRKMITHAMEMEDVERSIRREDELADLNRKFKMWDVEHLKQMNKRAREDNWLFQRTLLGGGSSVWSRQTLVCSRIFPTDRIIELDQEGSQHTARQSSVPQRSAHRTQMTSVQSVLQQKLRGKFENLIGSDEGQSVKPLVVPTEEVRDIDTASNYTFPASESVSDEVTSGKEKEVQELDSSVSHFSEASITSLGRKDKLSRILDSLQKIDKLIFEEKDNAKKQVLLLNERFLHLRERTKTELKLLRVKIRECKTRGQENLISTLIEKKNSLLQNLEDVKRKNLEEHDEICKATAKRKKALRQQKAIIQSYLKVVQSRTNSISEEQIKTSEGVANISSVTDKEVFSNFSSKREKESKQISNLESSQLPELSRHKQMNVSSEANDSYQSNSSLTQTHKSSEMTDDSEGVEYSPHRESVSEICDLEDRVKTLKESLQKKKNDADKLWKEQQQKKKERLRVKESRLLKRIQAYDEYIDKLKRELEESNSSTIDITLQSEHRAHDVDSVSASRRELFEDLISNKTISNIHQYDSDEFHSSGQTEELSYSQKKEKSSSKDINNDTSLESSTVRRYKIKDSDEISMKNDSEIEEKSEILKIEEKSEIILEVDEVEEISGVATEMKENSEIITEVSEKSEIISEVEEKSDIVIEDGISQLAAGEQENSEIAVEVATEMHGSNEMVTEVEEESLMLTQIEGKSEPSTDKSSVTTQPVEDSYLFTELEEKSHITTEIGTRHGSITELEENILITTEDENHDINTNIEENEEKSEINSEIEEEAEFIAEEDKSEIIMEIEENAETTIQTEQHSNFEGKYSEILTESEELKVENDFEIKGDIESEIISRTGDFSEILSEKDASKLVSEVLKDSVETDKTSENLGMSGLKMLDMTSKIEQDRNEKENSKKSKSKNIEFTKEIEEEMIQQQSRPEDDDDVTESYSKHFQDEKSEENEDEKSILEKLSYRSSAIGDSEGGIESPAEKLLDIVEKLASIPDRSGDKIIAVEIPDHEVEGEALVEVEGKVDKTEDTSSDIISSIMEEVSETSDDASDNESLKKKRLLSQKADRITDAILKKILSESLVSLHKVVTEIISDDTESSGTQEDLDEIKRSIDSNTAQINETENNKNNVNNQINSAARTENITNMILDELLRDSTKIAYENKSKIINSKISEVNSSESSRNETEISSGKETAADVTSRSDVRRRIHEILTESNTSSTNSREKTRPQDFMITTYDVLSPEDSPSESPQPDSSSKFEMVASEDVKEDLKVEKRSCTGEDQTGGDGFSQEWFDEDFGLSTTRREAEELRLQQLQIEQEIQELEQAQEHLPYFYFREIPNKPPPPYTPPGQTPATKPEVVPCTSKEITTLTMQVTDYFYNIVTSGGDVSNSEPPPEFYEDSTSSGMSDIKLSNKRIFKKLIFDLTRDLVKEAFGVEEVHSSLPWEWSSELSKKRKPPLHSKEILQEIIRRKVLEHFDSVLKYPREKPTTSWSRKKQDFVDEILVKESHKEESDWTNYEQDEITVKNDITKKILDKLLDETVQLLSYILNRKCGNLCTVAL